MEGILQSLRGAIAPGDDVKEESEALEVALQKASEAHAAIAAKRKKKQEEEDKRAAVAKPAAPPPEVPTPSDPNPVDNGAGQTVPTTDDLEVVDAKMAGNENDRDRSGKRGPPSNGIDEDSDLDPLADRGKGSEPGGDEAAAKAAITILRNTPTSKLGDAA